MYPAGELRCPTTALVYSGDNFCDMSVYTYTLPNHDFSYCIDLVYAWIMFIWYDWSILSPFCKGIQLSHTFLKPFKMELHWQE